MVFKLQELIRTAIFALIGLALIIALIVFLSPKDKAQTVSNYIPGTYSSQIILHSKPVNILVTVTEDEITSIALSDMKTEQEAFYPLFKPTLDSLSKQIIKYQTTKIATQQENAITSKILLDAVDSALDQAKSGKVANN